MADTPNFLDIDPEFSDPERAAITVLPVPYDATSSWVKGADKGPAALLRASAHVEWFDIAYRVYLFGLVGLGVVVWVSDIIEGLFEEPIAADLIVGRSTGPLRT